MNTTPNVLAFLQEIVARLKAKSPAFFKVINWIAAITTVLTGLPGLLIQLGITLTPALTILENKTVAIASMAALLISKLTVANATTTSLPYTENQTTVKGVSAAPNDSTASTK